MSQITRGSSTATAKPSASVLSAMPGPEVEVMPRAPAYAAPIAEVIAAISSSAWKVITPKSLYMESSCKMSEAGVIGYEAQRQRRVSADVAIHTGRKFRRRNFVADLKRFGGFAVAVAGLHGELVGLN